MTETQLKGEDMYEYHVPSKTKYHQDIDPNRRKEYIDTLENKSMEINGGLYWLPPGGKGVYKDDKGDKHYDCLDICHTHGKLPLSNEEVEFFTDYLSQKCLIVIHLGKCKAYLHEGKPEDYEINYQYNYGDGSITQYCMQRDENDEIRIEVTYFNENGEFEGGDEMYEDEIFNAISSGDDVLSKFYNEHKHKKLVKVTRSFDDL
jgi:hypothetical protein